jgi:hypothetical protein
MHALLGIAMRQFFRAFVAALVVYAVGLFAAPDLAHVYLVGVAGLVASVGAGLSAVLAYFPEFSFARWLGHPLGNYVDAFLYAFAGSLAITLPGVAGAPNLSTVHSLVVAALTGALSAGVRSIEGLLTRSESPVPALGIEPPESPVTPARQ